MKKHLVYLLLCVAFFGCKKTNTDISDDSTFFGRFNGYAGSISTQTPPGTGKASYSASSGSYSSSMTGPTISVTFIKQTLTSSGGGTPSAAEFQGFFGTGTLSFVSNTNANGIAIHYTDNNGFPWNSERGDQTGSVFTITKSQPSGNNVKIEAEFTCKLYDAGLNVMQLSGGTFTGQFRQ